MGASRPPSRMRTVGSLSDMARGGCPEAAKPPQRSKTRPARSAAMSIPSACAANIDTLDRRTGELEQHWSSEELADGVVHTRCNNRRASRCEPCSRLPTGHLAADRRRPDRRQGVPDTVADHPTLFVTLVWTAPSLGPLHTRVTDGSGRVAACRAGDPVWGAPKAEAGCRSVALPSFVAAALRDHQAEYSQPGPDGLVFTPPAGGSLRRSNYRCQVWLPALARAGLDRLCFHDLRHTAVRAVDRGRRECARGLLG